MACRFAPSPTGIMHMGNLRTAIFNYLFSKIKNIPFYLRIEDTDFNRSTKEYEESILKICNFLNIQFDIFANKPFIRQSECIEQHVSYATKLLDKKHAFYCKCDHLPEKFQKCPCREKEYSNGVLRFKVPYDGSTIFQDVNYGKIVTPNSNIEDFALLRSDGKPTYMLSVVVDDYLMDISHVIRGEDHKNSTPKQILLYRAFNWKEPTFIHLPLIVNKDGKKLSKRSCDANILSWIQEGYTASGIFNYLLKLGFGYKNEEKISFTRALEIFDLKQLKKSPSMANMSKLKHLSSYYLKTEIFHKDKIFNLVKFKYPEITEEIFNVIYPDIIHRCFSYNCFLEHLSFINNYKLDISIFDRVHMGTLVTLLKNIEQITTWNLESVREVFNNLDKSVASQNLRLVLTNCDRSIGVLYILLILGQQETLNRLIQTIRAIESDSGKHL